VAALLLFVMIATPASAGPTAPALERAFPAVTEYADLELKYQRAQVALVRATRGRFAQPTRLPRFRGRFKVQLSRRGETLLEVPFDFPLLASAEVPDVMSAEATRAGAQLRAGVTATTVVRVPLPAGVDSAFVCDGERRLLSVALAGEPAKPPTAPGTGARPQAAPAGAPPAR
jgi:hypothetical protein